MKQITDINELRNVQLDILSYVDEICRKHDISYSMSGGTLIGAIRHNGYIPWDDDIDIMLTRDDYEQLIIVMNDLYNEGSRRYKILTHDTDPNFKYPYAKVVDEDTLVIEKVKGCRNYGVFIDVFPIDYIPDRGKCLLLFTKMRVLFYLLNLKHLMIEKKRTFVKNVVVVFSHLLLFPLSDDWIIFQMNKIAKRANKTKTDRRCCLVWGYGKKEIVPASIHCNHIDILFENRKYMAIKDYEIYLNKLFGNYMQLPPLEQRVTHHDFIAYWK